MATRAEEVGPSPKRLWHYATKRLKLKPFFEKPGDGRVDPLIPARDLLWGQVVGQLLREHSFHGIEALANSDARKNLLISRAFGDDALGYFNERLEPSSIRQALSSIASRAKRNKAFAKSGLIGLAIDGTGAGRRQEQGCELCHSIKTEDGKIHGYNHKLCMAAVVGVGMTLPLDVEPYGATDSEYAAGGRLLERLVGNLGKRFADHVVVDAGFSTAPFLRCAGKLGLRVVARLKGNLPELYAAARKRFESEPPHSELAIGRDRVELWDNANFDPWGDARVGDRACRSVPPTQAQRRRARGPTGSLTTLRFWRAPRAYSGLPRVAGRSRTRGSTKRRRPTASSTFLTTTRAVSSSSGSCSALR